MARKVVDAVNPVTCDPIYFKGHAKATYMSDGVSVETTVQMKQDTLVSGQNIKTINNVPILGSGNIVIPKGDKGDKGDTGPRGLQGPQGLQGNSGYTGAANELQIVNNLTDGGETAALSAEQGKILKSELTELSVARTLSEDVNKAIKELYLIGADKSKEYKILVVDQNSGVWRFYIAESANDSVVALATTPIGSENNIIEFNPFSNSGIKGYAVVDFYELKSTSYSFSGSKHGSLSTSIFALEANSTIYAQISELSLSAEIGKLDFESVKSDIDLIRHDNKIWISSSKYFDATDNIDEYVSYPIAIKGQHRGVVNGVKISIRKGGTVTLGIAKGLSHNSPTFTELQTFQVVDGINFLEFTQPVTIEDDWGIVVMKPTSAALSRPAREHTDDIGAKYYNGSAWAEYNGIVMATYSYDMSNAYKRIEDIENLAKISYGTIKTIAQAGNYIPLLGSARFGKVSESEKAIAAVFIDGQETLTNKTIVGMKVSVEQEGTIVLCRCKGYKTESFSIEKLQSYDVIKGDNYLLLDTPIVLSENEAFGVDVTSTAAYHRGGYDSEFNKGFWYFHPTHLSWIRSGADLVMSVLTNDMSDTEIDDVNAQINNTNAELDKVKSATLSAIVYPTAPPSLYGHLFVSKIHKSSSPTIPCQSVFDVAVSSALGFKMIEFNVLTTSDGVFVTGHPVSGTLQTLTDLQGNNVELDISVITFAELRSNYRYKSTLPQYRTYINTLEECLRACQFYDITPFVQCTSKGVVELVESIVGKRYVAYSAQRAWTDATIYEYHSSGNADTFVERCKAVGTPFVIGLNPDILDTMSDADLKNLIGRIHAEKCWINWAGCYHTAESNMRMKKLGLDSCASGWEVPFFNDFDIKKYGSSIKGFADFGGTFTTSADGAVLSSGQTMYAEIAKMGIVAKGQLSIHFKGSLTIRFGEINATFESDGSEVTIMNSVIENREAGLLITASADTIIYSIDYKTASVL